MTCPSLTHYLSQAADTLPLIQPLWMTRDFEAKKGGESVIAVLYTLTGDVALLQPLMEDWQSHRYNYFSLV